MDAYQQKQQAKESFGQRFSQAFEQAGFSKMPWKAIEEVFGVSTQAIRKWMWGQSLPTPARIVQLAQILDVTPEWLQYGHKPTVDEIPLDLVDQAILQQLKHLSIEQKQTLLRFLQSLQQE